MMSEMRAYHIFYQVADAVSHMHGLGIAHRDLKLSNIFCEGSSDYPLVYVGDFGHATQLAEEQLVI